MTLRGANGTALPFEESRLENGLRLIVHEDRSAPVVAVHLMLHVGSKNEVPGLTGFAHLFEHLLFQGSEHVPPGAHFVHVQEAGGTLNGSTWFDRTNYFEIVPSPALEMALWLESDRLGWFLAGLTEEKFEAQRSVVMNERRQRYENQPYGLWMEETLGLAYPEGHPYRHPTIGSMDDLAAATVDDARAFFRSHYRPGNATLVLAGDVDPDEARAAVERWFGGIPPAEGPSPPVVPEGRLETSPSLTREDDVELPRVHLTWHAPAWAKPGSLALDVAARVLAGGPASRLHRELVHRRRLAQDVTAVNYQPLEETGLFLVILTGKPGVEPAALTAAFDEVAAALANDGPTDSEMERSRSFLRLAHLASLESVGGRADALAHAAVLLDDPGYVSRRMEELDAVDGSEVRHTVRDRIATAHRVNVTYVPRRG